MRYPLVSVIMSVYGEKPEYIHLAINSILSQSYPRIEFIIVNDHPDSKLKSELSDYVKEFESIIVVNNKENIGLAASLNRAIGLSSGDYIARMDADDVSLENRIDKQLSYLNKEGYDLVGSFIERIDSKGNGLGVSVVPSDVDKLKKLLPYATIAFHPTWFGKSEVFKSIMYNPIFITSQDYDFLHRATKKGYKISNVEEVLLKYRIAKGSLSLNKAFIQVNLHELINVKARDINFNLDKEVSGFLESYDRHREAEYFRAFYAFLCFIDTRDIKYMYRICQGLIVSKSFRLKVRNFTMSKMVQKIG